MSNASIGYEADILKSDTQNGTYTALLSEPVVVNVPPTTITKVPATHLKSPNRTKEYKAGMKDPGESTIEAHWIAADYAALVAIEGVEKWFKIVSPDLDGAGTITPQNNTFPGYIHDIQLGFNADDGNPTKMTFTIVQTGARVVS